MAHGKQVQGRCSFCGKGQEQVHRLIAGPGAVYICSECIDLCREIVEAETPSHAEPVPGRRAKAVGPGRTESGDAVREVAVGMARLLEGYDQRLRSIEERLAALEQKP